MQIATIGLFSAAAYVADRWDVALTTVPPISSVRLTRKRKPRCCLTPGLRGAAELDPEFS
jgi:hypothetical protein